MPVLNRLRDNISEIYSSWEALSDQDKKQKINLILPVIQVASYLENLHGTHETSAERYDVASTEPYHLILAKFKNDYQNIFGQDLTLTQTSDIAPELMQRLTEVQNGGTKLSADETNILLSYKDKYIHAHSRVAFNYGRFLAETHPHLDAESKALIKKKFSLIQNSKDDQEVLAALVGINQDFEIELHSAHLGKDDLENHALLNQMSNWMQHIAQIPQVLLCKESKLQAIKALSSSNSPQQMEVKRSNEIPNQSSLLQMEKSLAAKDMAAAVGIETEFLVRPLRLPTPQVGEKSAVQKNIEIKKIIGDLNARRKMQKKYGLTPTIPEISDARYLFLPTNNDVDLHGGISVTDHKIIIDHISAHFEFQIQKLTTDSDKLTLMQARNEVLDQVANFTEAETFFYKLFFLTSNTEINYDQHLASIRKIDMEGIYSPLKSKAENLEKALPLITKGLFHENLLDMIEACEVSFGPYSFSEVISQKNQAIEGMRELANKTNASIDNPNIQLNLSFQIKNRKGQMQHIFMPKITGRGADAHMEFTALDLEFIHLIEEAVAESAGIYGMLRNQKEIGAAYDRKKTIGANEESQLWGSNYLQIDPNKPAFLNHKSLAAKNDTLRLSTIKANSAEELVDGIAVCEIRLIGNNSHFARFNDSQTINANGLDFIPEHLMPKIAEKIGIFVEKKSKNELLDLLETPTQMHNDGRFEGLESVPVVNAIARDNELTLKSKTQYIPKLHNLLDGVKN